MPGNTKPLVLDVNAKPAPQYFNPSTDAYEYLLGRNGATRVELYGPDGNPIATATGNKLAVRAQEIEAILGEVSGTPTANTLADRLKAIADRLGEVSANPTANTALARLRTIEGYLDGLEAALGTQADAEATGNGSLIAIVKRLRTIITDVWNDAANALNVQLTGSMAQAIRDQGFEPVVAHGNMLITPGSTVTLQSDVTEPCVIEGLEFSGSLTFAHAIYVELRNNSGSYSVVSQALASSIFTYVDFGAVNIYGHSMFDILKNDTTNNRYKFGLKRPLPAPRGFRIKARNNHTADITITMALVYRKLVTP